MPFQNLQNCRQTLNRSWPNAKNLKRNMISSSPPTPFAQKTLKSTPYITFHHTQQKSTSKKQYSSQFSPAFWTLKSSVYRLLTPGKTQFSLKRDTTPVAHQNEKPKIKKIIYFLSILFNQISTQLKSLCIIKVFFYFILEMPINLPFLIFIKFASTHKKVFRFLFSLLFPHYWKMYFPHMSIIYIQ